MAQVKPKQTATIGREATPPRAERIRSSNIALQPLAPKLLQVVLFKGADVRKEFKISPGLLPLFEFEARQLDTAYIIGNLRENIPPRGCVSKKGSLTRQPSLDCGVNGICNYTLAAIVIDFHAIKALEVLQIRIQQLGYIRRDPLGKTLCARKSPLFLIAAARIPEWQPLTHVGKRNKLLLATIEILPFVVIMPCEQRAKVERSNTKTPIHEHAPIMPDDPVDAVILLMEHKRNKVVLRDGASISRLIDEDGKLLHTQPSPKTKMPGGILPAFEGPPIRRIRSLYTTNRNVESIIAKTEHMFYTKSAGNCSEGRKVA